MVQFTFDEAFWVAEAAFDSWRGFQSRHGAYGALSSPTASDGAVRLVFAPDGGRAGDGRDPLTAAERALVDWFLDREPEVSAAVLSAIFAAYPSLRADDGDPGGDIMPDLGAPGDLEPLIGLHTVHVHPLRKDGAPYLGFELGCTWDEEHGLGVLMHGAEAVEIGGADTAFLLWIAERNAGRG